MIYMVLNNQMIRGYVDNLSVAICVCDWICKKGFIAFLIAWTWQPITSIVNKVLSWKSVTVYP